MKITKKIWIDWEHQSILGSHNELVGVIAREHEEIVKSDMYLDRFLRQKKNYNTAAIMFKDMFRNEKDINQLYREFDSYAYYVAEERILARYKEIEIEI